MKINKVCYFQLWHCWFTSSLQNSKMLGTLLSSIYTKDLTMSILTLTINRKLPSTQIIKVKDNGLGLFYFFFLMFTISVDLMNNV